MNKTVIVTGGAGFIGSCFVAQQVFAGKHVVVLDKLTYCGNIKNLECISHTDNGSWELVKGDIQDKILVKELLKKYNPSALVNFAAESHVDNSISSPESFLETNILGCYTLLEAVREHLATLSEENKKIFRYVQISTDEVYGSLGAEGKFTETSPMQPNSPYSATKASADMLCRAWFHTYGLPIIVTHCSNNYGPRQFPEKLIPLMITTALAGEKLPIYGDGKNIRDWIHVEDHCSGITLAMEKGVAGEIYAFGGNAERNNIQVVDTICETLDALYPRADGLSYKEQKSFVCDRLGHDRRYAIDDTKSQRELGFKRLYDFEAGLRDTIIWYLDNMAQRPATGQKKVA